MFKASIGSLARSVTETLKFPFPAKIPRLGYGLFLALTVKCGHCGETALKMEDTPIRKREQ
jgi:hypothetical protein